jgi:predicted dehydrogenase
MTRKKLNVAVVGLGVGRNHLEAYRSLPELFNVTSVCDADPARLSGQGAAWTATSLQSLLGEARTTTRLQEVLDSDDVDIVNLCTPPNTHLPLARQALAAGKHVVCEKPLVGSLAECDALEAAVAAAAPKTQLFPVFQYRFGNGLQKLLHLRARGFGRHAMVSTVETHWRRDADYYAIAWRGKWATEMGGVCLTQAIHAHDILTHVLGAVKTVYARLATRVNDIEGEDCAAVSLQMADGSLATLSATLGAAAEQSRLKFVFDDMTAESDSPNPYRPGEEPWHFKGKTPSIDAAIQAALADFVPGPESFAGQFARMHATLTTGAPAPVTLADARASLELITALYHSGEVGSAVTLPILQGHPKYASWTPTGGGFPKALPSHG